MPCEHSMEEATLAKFLEHLNSQGVRLREPATADEVRAFEQRNGVCIPADMSAYVRTLNGTLDMDPDLFLFWPLSAFSLSAVQNNEKLFVFADYSISAAEYVVSMSSERGLHSTIYTFDGQTHRVIAQSLCEFTDLYMRDPHSLILNSM